MKIILTERQAKIILEGKWISLRNYHEYINHRGTRKLAEEDPKWRRWIELYDRFVKNATPYYHDCEKTFRFFYRQVFGKYPNQEGEQPQNYRKLKFNNINERNVFYSRGYFCTDEETRLFIFKNEKDNEHNSVFEIYNELMKELNKLPIKEPELNEYPTPKIIIYKKSVEGNLLVDLKKSLKGLNIQYDLSSLHKSVPTVSVFKDTIEPKKLKALKNILLSKGIKAEYIKS